MKKLFSLFCAFAFFFSLTQLQAQADSCEYNLMGVTLNTQIWAAEMSWELANLNGDIVASGGNYADNSTYSSQFCLEDGCYTLILYDSFGDGWNGGTIAISMGNTTIASPVFLSGSSESITFGINELDCGLLIEGCTDPFAINYNPLASIDDGSCDYQDSTFVYGCTDPFAINYDPAATINDGSCEYDGICVEGYISGIPDGSPIIVSNGFFTATAITNNGSFYIVSPGVAGNTFVFVEFIDCNGVSQTVIAEFAVTCFVVDAVWCDEIEGCTDQSAINYDPLATIDDGSCIYDTISCNQQEVTIQMFLIQNNWLPIINLTDAQGTIIFSGAIWDPGYEQTFCLPVGCYNLEALSVGAGNTNLPMINIYVNGTLVETVFDTVGDPTDYPFGVLTNDCETSVFGCTDPVALNYDPDATVDNGSCVYPPDSCFTNTITFMMTTGTFATEVSWTLSDNNGNIIYVGENYSTNDQTYIEALCLEDGCYTIEAFDAFGDGWNGGILSVFDGTVPLASYSLDQGEYGVFSFGVNESDCQTNILGCTDPDASNYNPWATIDDGSCIYPFSCDSGLVEAQLYICTFQNGQNVGISVIGDDGSIAFTQDGFPTNNIEYIDICLDPEVCYTVTMWNNDGPFGWYNGYYWINYANGAQIITGALDNGLEEDIDIFALDGSCFEEILGCIDPTALNYDPWANVDDGSCEYLCDSTLVPAQLYVCTFANGWEVGMSITGSNGDVIYSQDGFPTNNIEYIDLCLDPDECYTIEMWNNTAPNGWYGGYFWINSITGSQFVTGELNSGQSSGTITFSVNGNCGDVYGCTDPFALNYNPLATTDDGSCEYDLPVENDLCEDASVLTPGTWLISNVGAYQNEGMDGDCWGFGNGEEEQTSIWFEITTPTFDAEIFIQTSADGTNSLTDTQFGFYEECGGEMIYCDGNSGDGLFSAFYFGCGELSPNTTYLLQIDGWSADEGTCLLTYEYSTCDSVIFGCTDSTAVNYDPFATVDDGSCLYDSLGGCVAFFEIYYVDEVTDVVYIENLSSGPYLEYFWDFGDGSTSYEEFPMHEYGEDGTYTVCLTVWSQITGGLCQDTYCLDVVYNGSGFVNTGGFTINVVPPGTPLGINEYDFIRELTLYPNPSTDEFTVEISGNNNADLKFEILDISGRLVYESFESNSGYFIRKTINVHDLENGPYLLRISSGNAFRTTKFSIIR